MTLAMYAAVVAFQGLALDPFVMLVPGRRVLRARLRAAARLINRFIHRPEHTQMLLHVALAIILGNGLLIGFGPDARNVQTSYQLDSFELGPLLSTRRASTPRARRCWRRRCCRVLSLHRSPARRSAPAPTTRSARASRACPSRTCTPDVRARRRLRRGGRAARWSPLIDVTPALGPGVHAAGVRHRDRRRARLDGRRAPRRRAHRGLRGARGRAASRRPRRAWSSFGLLILVLLAAAAGSLGGAEG